MRLRSWCLLACLALAPTLSACDNGSAAAPAVDEQTGQPAVPLPNKAGTFKFAVLGDFGTGDKSQYDLAQQMKSVYDRFKYELVILVGDNIYGSDRPQDFKRKFEIPYK